MRALGVIPARGGSKGLPGKNLMRLGGKTLLEWAMESALAATSLTRICVTTDDDQVFAATRGHQVVTIRRPPELATDECGMVPVLQHAVNALAENWESIGGKWTGGQTYDLIVCLQPTSPFRTGEDIDQTVALVADADSAQTVSEAPYPPSKLLSVNDGFGEYADYFKAREDTRRQDHKTYQPSGAVYATRRHVLMSKGAIIGPRHRAHIVPWERSININTLWDFRIAEMIYAHRHLG